MRQLNRRLTTCLLGLAAAVSLACALPAENGDPSASNTAAPQWGIETTQEVEPIEPWAPSEQWLELYEWDQEIQDLRAAGEMDEYHEQHREFENWIVQNPDADIPCQAMQRYGPREMQDNCTEIRP